MEWSLTTVLSIGGTLVGVLGVLVRYLILDKLNAHADQINRVEKAVTEKVSEEEVRRILSDKLDPMNSDIKEIKDDVKKVYDLFLTVLTKPK